MHVGFRHKPGGMAARFMNRYILLLLASMLLVQSASAEDDIPMSPSVVLVLKLISATHVKPTTGIVVSDDGMVLVPADFIGASNDLADAEIVVLDGGTDIFSHGRPAKVVNRFVSDRFAVLSVKGLKRPGFKLAEDIFKAESELHLAAFPPAELIAKGAQPLWLPVKVQDHVPGDGSEVLSPESPLPYVSGPVIDECGNLAGFSLTHGSQSMDTGTAPEIIFVDELNRILVGMQLSLPTASCEKSLQNVTPTESLQGSNKLAIENAKQEEQLLSSDETNVPAKQSPPAEAATLNQPEPAFDDTPVGNQETHAYQNKTPVVKTSTRPSLWRSVPFWLPVLVFIVLAVLIWKAIFFFRTGKIQPASEEPDTSVLKGASDPSSVKPRSVPVNEAEALDMTALPDGCDGVIVIEGILGGDVRFKRFCFVNTQQINIVIGRGEVDIVIELPAISRNHARLERHADIMTLSDLGSNNGTCINGIPCLPGEIMFVESEDEIFLGDVQIRIRMIKNEVNPS